MIRRHDEAKFLAPVCAFLISQTASIEQKPSSCDILDSDSCVADLLVRCPVAECVVPDVSKGSYVYNFRRTPDTVDVFR